MRSPDSYIAQTGTASTFSASRCGSLVDIAELSGDLAHVLRIYLHRFISCSIPWRALVISTSMQRAPSGRNPAPPPLLITMAEASRKVCFASASAPVTSGFLIPTPSSRITDLSFTCAARKSLKAACFPAHSAVLKKLLPSAMLTRIGAPHLSHLGWYSLGTRQPSTMLDSVRIAALTGSSQVFRLMSLLHVAKTKTHTGPRKRIARKI